MSKTFKQWEAARRQQFQNATTSSSTLGNRITKLPPRNPDFARGDDLLIRLSEFLSVKEASEQKYDEQVKGIKLLAICGEDGIGKSELALEFAYKNHDKYEFIRWFNAGNPKILKNEFEKFTELLEIDVKSNLGSSTPSEDIIRHVHTKLQKIPRWLLIFDDTSNLNEINMYIPSTIQSENQHILVTSKNCNWEKQLKLGVFNVDDAIKFIQGKLPQETIEDAKQLCELLAFSPLGLSQSIAFLQQQSSNMTIQKYMEIFQTKNFIGLTTEENEQKKISNVVMKTLSISIDALLEQQPGSIELLSFSAYLNSAGISQDLVEELIARKKQNEKGQNETKYNDNEAETLLMVLYQYSLIDSSDVEGEFKIHPIVQSLLRTRDEIIMKGSSENQPIELIVNNRLKVIKETLISMYPCSKSYEQDFVYAATIAKQMMSLSSKLIELQQSSGKLNSELGKTIQVMTADLGFCLGDFFGSLGDIQNQKVLLEEALNIYEEVYGLNHFQIANTLINLGNVYEDLGDIETKKNLLERALAINEQHFGPNHTAIVPILTNLGNTFADLGDTNNQKELLERALTIFQQQCGSDDFAAIPILTNLGNAYGDLGDVKKQKELLETALKMMQKEYGSEYFLNAMIMIDLANAYCDLGDDAKSTELLEQALKINEQYYGTEHVEVARTLTYLGNSYRMLGQTEKSQEILERSLRIQEEHYGAEHFEVATTLNNLANVYGGLGDFQKSKELLDRALKIREDYYGPDHFQVANTLINLGITFGNLGQLEKSIEVSERALNILQGFFGPDHFRVAPAQATLGIAYGQLGNLSKMQELLGNALAIFQDHYGPSNPRTVFIKSFLLQQEPHANHCCILM